MNKSIFFKKENLLAIILFFFSVFINQYYAGKGVSPHDSFSHFDTGYRILQGEYPFNSYWIISGPLIDYIQSIFFYLFGTSWKSYVFHASFFNGIVTLATFFVLIKFKVKIIYSFLFSLLFGILAYPSSGTPFVDHHATFFSLLGIYCLMLAIKTEKNYYWYLLPVFYIFGFLSKQVPTVYVGIISVLILILYSLVKNNYKWIIPIFLSSSLLILFFGVVGFLYDIKFSSFIEQYIVYPRAIGSERFQNYEFNFSSVILQFKYIHISLIILSFSYFWESFKYKKFIIKEDFIYFFIILLFTFSLIFHQMITKNQIYIFFLIPIIVGFSFSQISKNKYLTYIIIIFCIFVTSKYHLRFNEERKFHDLNYTDLNMSLDAKLIDNKLNSLKWITPDDFKKKPAQEIKLLVEVKDYLKKENNNFMLLTNYSFFSAMLEKKTYSTIRWYTGDGTDYPREKNKFHKSYKNLFIEVIKRNNIKIIYSIYPIKEPIITDYLNENCFIKSEITQLLTKYDLKKCNELN